MSERQVTRDDIIGEIADSLFDCYWGYNTETRLMMRLQEDYILREKASRVLVKLEGMGLISKPDPATTPTPQAAETADA